MSKSSFAATTNEKVSKSWIVRFTCDFLRNEQKWHPKSTFQKKFLITSTKSIKTKYFIAFSVKKSESCHIKDKKSLFLWFFFWETKDFKFQILKCGVGMSFLFLFQEKSPVPTSSKSQHSPRQNYITSL